MSFFRTKRGMTIVGALAAALVALIIFFLARGCEEETDQTKTTNAETGTAATVTDEVTVAIISQSVSPSEATEAGSLSFTVLVRGEVTGVSLTDQLPPANAGGQPRENFTRDMSLVSRDGDISTWMLQATASGLGRHLYFATAVKADGTTVQAAGDPPTYVVSAASQAQAQPQADQLPLQIATVTTNQGSDYDNSYNQGQPVQVSVHIPLWLPVNNQTVAVEQPVQVYIEYQLLNGPVRRADLTFWKNDQGHSWWTVNIAPDPGSHSLTAFAVDPDGTTVSLADIPFAIN